MIIVDYVHFLQHEMAKTFVRKCFLMKGWVIWGSILWWLFGSFLYFEWQVGDLSSVFRLLICSSIVSARRLHSLAMEQHLASWLHFRFSCFLVRLHTLLFCFVVSLRFEWPFADRESGPAVLLFLILRGLFVTCFCRISAKELNFSAVLRHFFSLFEFSTDSPRLTFFATQSLTISVLLKCNWAISLCTSRRFFLLQSVWLEEALSLPLSRSTSGNFAHSRCLASSLWRQIK